MKQLPSLLNDFENLFFGQPTALAQVFAPPVLNKMPLNIIEKETSFEVQAHLPGFDKSEINVSVKDGYLLIDAKKEVKNEQSNERFVRKEYSVQSFSRQLSLGSEVVQDASLMTAKMENGVLMLNIPKKNKEEAKSNSINIE